METGGDGRQVVPSNYIEVYAQGVRMRFAKMAVILLVLLFVPASMVYGQSAVGEVNGTVTDNSGAVVAGATVDLINEATKIENRATTNSNGYFVFINVKPGKYVLGVEAQGFKTIQISSFDVGVSQTVTQAVRLEIGQVTETVKVIAQAEMIERSSSELGTVIEQRVVNDLPLNGRNFTQLLTLAPGVTPVSTAQNKSIGCCEGNVGIPGSGFSDASFHGQQNRSKLYFFDGIINTNIRGPTYIVIPNTDLVQEFKVVGHDAKAEFGGATGGVVNMVSTSGGNSYHGSAFEYVRNDAFDARNTFTDFDPLTKAPRIFAFRQNQFGAAVTGPIIKNKTLISGGYDGWRYSKPSLNLSYVPTALELGGDFSQTTAVKNTELFNPYSTTLAGARTHFKCDATTGAPITPDVNKIQTGGVNCNKVPSGLINPAMQKFLQTYSPTPNLTGNPAFNYQQIRPDTNVSNSFQVRVDHRFRDSDNVFFRYTEQRVSGFTAIGDVGFTSGGSQGRNYGGGWVHTFRPNLILDVRAGYAGRPGVDAGQQNQSTLGTKPMTDLGFKDIDKYGGMLVNLNNDWKSDSANFGTRGPAPRENPNWSVTPNLIWIKGNHNLKTGFWFIDSKRVQLNTFQTFNFRRSQSADPNNANTGLTLASALLGLPSDFSAQLPVLHGGPVRYKYAAWAAYVQDEWKIKPKLTVSLGLRFDALTQPQVTDGRLWSTMDLTNKQYVIGASTMPPLCSQAQQAPCIPDGGTLYTPTNSTCNNNFSALSNYTL